MNNIIATSLNKNGPHLLFGIVVPLFISFILLNPLIINSGIPFSGDTTWYKVNAKNILHTYYLWKEGNGAKIPIATFATLPLLSYYLLGAEIAVKLYILLIASLPYIFTYFAALIFSNELLIKNKYERIVMGIVTGLITMLAFTNAGLTHPGTILNYIYVAPLIIGLSIRYIKYSFLQDLILIIAISLLAIANPFFIYYVVIFMSIYILSNIVFYKKYRDFCYIKRILILGLTVTIATSFVYIPSLIGYLYSASGPFTSYTTTNLINESSLRFLSHVTLLDIFNIGHYEKHFFWFHPTNYGIFNIILPILVSLPLLIYKKDIIYILYVILLIALFLTKGIHEPFGFFYLLIAENLPYGLGALLRNPTKFYPLVTIIYAFLIGLSVILIYRYAKLKFSKTKLQLIYTNIIIVLLILAIIFPIIHGSYLYLKVFTYNAFEPICVPDPFIEKPSKTCNNQIPEPYYNITNYFSNEKDDFSILWLPMGGSYIWKTYIITDFPDGLIPKPAYSISRIITPPSLNNIMTFIKSNNTLLGDIFSQKGIKYIIYHNDTLNDVNELAHILQNNNDLEIIKVINYTIDLDALYKEEKKSNYIYAYDYSPFEIIKPQYFQRNNFYEVMIRYEIPEDILKDIKKNKFNNGFNIRLQGMVHDFNYKQLEHRIFDANSIIDKQIIINEKEGFAFFNIKIPSSTPTTKVDLWAWFYGGSFKPLTQPYFLGTLPIKNNKIDIQFIVFENKKYNGKIFGINADIVEYKRINPVEWMVKIKPYNEKSTIVFTEPFDPLWAAYIEGDTIYSKQFRNMNSFILHNKGNSNDIIEIKLYYTLQYYYYLSLLIIISYTIIIITIKRRLSRNV